MKKKWISMLAAAAMLTGTLAGCAPKPVDSTTAATEAPAGTSKETEAGQEETPAADLPVLKVAVMPFLNSIPIEYMINEGLDVKNGFKIETVYFANGGAMNEALAADQWEVGTLSAAAVNSLAIYGAYCIADIGHSEGGLYTLCKPDSPIAQVKGANPSYPDVYGDAETLKGAVIATNTGTISHLNVIKWLEKLGLTTDDVEIVHMDFPSAYQALMTGNCDVAALNPPTSYQAEAEGMIVTSSLTTLGVPQFDSIIVSNKAFTGKRDVLVNYVKAFFEATDALQADPDMAAQLLLDWYTENGSESSLDACKNEIATRPFVTSEEAKTITIGDSVQVTGEFWVSQELLEESKFPEIAKHVDDTIVKEALGY
ncbi:ABC transporter substrate-binding protein [Enterocloster lavalensis]|uniref:ABC transporter substrate-binding protein n=1 Tax=Enterocloster lavalensis TaxID=460384 RepID=UPI001D06A649|nr:ABC transporter substrate-binding protein [Enterocloster lavalensis]MCB6341528.1 ABC transporter substrate-binding protein [Enterocloster lavalensis]